MIITVIGNTSSGKSLIAETIVTLLKDKRYYVATMMPFSKEGERKVSSHRKMRENKGFTTIEQYLNISEIDIDKNSDVLVECMSNLLANETFDEKGAVGNGLDVVEHIIEGIAKLSVRCENLIIVTNEVFCSGNRYDESCTEYIGNLGLINQKLAEVSDVLIEAVVGIPLIKKGSLPFTLNIE